MGDGSGGRKAMRRTVSFKTSQLAREWARGAVGSASDWQSEGQGFESPRVHQFLTLRSTAKHLVSISPVPGFAVRCRLRAMLPNLRGDHGSREHSERLLPVS